MSYGNASCIAAEVDPTRARARPLAGSLLFALGFAAATMAAAHMRVLLPFSPVPVTMQTMVVLLAGLCLGAGFGGLSQAKYLTLGLIGLPAFSGGIAALIGPSGGYLFGFVIGAMTAGWLYSMWRSTAGAIAACLVATATIYLAGCLWLAAVTVGSLGQVVAIGVLPFIFGDLLKIAAVVLLVRGPYTGAFIAKLFKHG